MPHEKSKRNRLGIFFTPSSSSNLKNGVMHEKALIKESVLETIRFRSTLNYGRNAHEHENIVSTAWFLQLNVCSIRGQAFLENEF